MPNYTYNGPDVSITLRGVVFPQGEEIEIDDKGLEAKLDALPYFTSDKPAPEVKPAVSVADGEQALLTKIAGLEAENAFLRRKLDEAVNTVGEMAIEAEIGPAPELEAASDEIESYTPGEPDTPPVDEEIPSDWREMHWKRQMVIAKKFTDEEVTDGTKAAEIIEKELARRDQDA